MTSSNPSSLALSRSFKSLVGNEIAVALVFFGRRFGFSADFWNFLAELEYSADKDETAFGTENFETNDGGLFVAERCEARAKEYMKVQSIVSGKGYV